MTHSLRKAAACAAALLPALAAAQERPNIILFLVDDMGWQETSVTARRTWSGWPASA